MTKTRRNINAHPRAPLAAAVHRVVVQEVIAWVYGYVYMPIQKPFDPTAVHTVVRTQIDHDFIRDWFLR